MKYDTLFTLVAKWTCYTRIADRLIFIKYLIGFIKFSKIKLKIYLYIVNLRVVIINYNLYMVFNFNR